MIATPVASGRAAAARRRAGATAIVLASSSRSWTSCGPHAARLRHQAAEHALVAGQRRAVRGRGARPDRRAAHLQHHHRDPGLARTRPGRHRASDRRRPPGTGRSRRAPPRRPGTPGSRRRRARPGCRWRSPCESAARGCVASALTATLPLWEISATWPASAGDRASPHSEIRLRGETIPLQLGPHTGRRWRAAAATISACSCSPSATSANPAPNTTAPPQPRSPACSMTSGTPGRRDPHDHGVHRLGQLGQAGHARVAQHLGAARVDPNTSPV